MGLVSQRDPLPSLQLDCAALAPLQAQLEQVWRLTQQCLCQGPCCSANRAAGFKRWGLLGPIPSYPTSSLSVLSCTAPSPPVLPHPALSIPSRPFVPPSP